jgi:HEAT repeat protein
MAPIADSVDPTISALRESLCSEDTPLPVRFRALFSLKHLATQSQDASAEAAMDAIAKAFESPSALLKHELAYCLGQTRNLYAVPPLRKCLADLDEDPMVRHEAAEALGAIGHDSNIDILCEYRDRKGENVAVVETCEIALDRIKWENSEERKQEKLRQR